MVPDARLDDVAETAAEDFAAVVLPGGLAGAKTFAHSAAVQKLLSVFEARNRLIGAICAAPMALAEAGVGHGLRVTSHPVAKPALLAEPGAYTYVEAPVVCDGKIITSRCPGTAMEFSLALVEALVGKAARETVRSGLYA